MGLLLGRANSSNDNVLIPIILPNLLFFICGKLIISQYHRMKDNKLRFLDSNLSHPGDRITSQAHLHPCSVSSIQPWLSRTPLNRTPQSPRAAETPETCQRVNPRDFRVHEISSEHAGSGVQIANGVGGTACASPLIIHVLVATASVERELIGVLETVPFAQGRAKLADD